MNQICRYPFVNLTLCYSYSALEPCIDCQTMRLHHDKHLQAYIDKLNKILSEHPELQNKSLRELLKNIENLPTELQNPIQNNAGGVYNHCFFFEGIAPPNRPSRGKKLLSQIQYQFGSRKNACAALKEAALSVFGSGYAWLVSKGGELSVLTTANQDTPNLNLYTPIWNIDLWEHAYYLKYRQLRADYVDAVLCLMNLNCMEERYLRSLCSR